MNGTSIFFKTRFWEKIEKESNFKKEMNFFNGKETKKNEIGPTSPNFSDINFFVTKKFSCEILAVVDLTDVQ